MAKPRTCKFKRAADGSYSVTTGKRGYGGATGPITYKIKPEPILFKSWAHNRGRRGKGWAIYRNGEYTGRAHSRLADAKKEVCDVSWRFWVEPYNRW